ncbi:TOMM precursor leader peptide-binding protein [Alicyclobacillus ferrooxydans]|uniref:Bacteriocin biosynthesis protein SagD n=1 Tax=Alicyclobacillus ferrooxydans TaxID=471514 RepID=A0A0P9GR65_9BACL|nr:TOMM precursor leader peptide-binding protein [Alicyclobacillus ferrooxydans]KPV43404.1 bacteriocin biosynthesis protein SagD [Alicyclobacillus ferrooxydans]
MTAHVLVVGDGVFADMVCRRLLEEKLCHLSRQSDFSSNVPPDLDLALVLDDAWHPAAHIAAEQVFRGRGIPWLRGFVSFGTGVVGPLVRPSHAGCSQCADWRTLMTESDRREMLQIRMQLGNGGVVLARDVWGTRTGLTQMAILLIREVGQALRDVENDSSVIDCEACSVIDHLICVNMKTLETTRHFVLPNASCPVCGALPEDTSDAAVIQLEPSPKLDAQSYRSRSMDDLQETLVHDYLDSRSGLFNAKVQDLITPYAAVSINLPLMMGDEGTSGRSHSYKECEPIAILEGLERFCGLEPRGKRTTVVDSYANLQADALNPASVGLHEPSQYARPTFPFQALSKDLPMEWVWGYSLTKERPILVPKQLAYYSLGCDGGFVYETSNGCALGGTRMEAVFHGILEVVERDAFLLTWYAQLPLPRVDLSSYPDSELQWMIARLRTVAGYDLHFFNATMENGIPTVFAIAKNRRSYGLNLMCSAGSHVDPMRATKSAIQETAGMLLRFDEKLETKRAEYLQMLRDSSYVRQMDDHSMLYGLPEAEERLGFLLREKRPVQSFEEAFGVGNSSGEASGTGPANEADRVGAANGTGPANGADGVGAASGTGPENGVDGVGVASGRHRDLTDDLKDLLAVFRRLNMDVIVVDQTSPEISRNGLSCVKVIIPGMLPMTFGHHLTRLEGLDRVLTVPMKLGYTTKPLNRKDLNPYPHPFP